VLPSESSKPYVLQAGEKSQALNWINLFEQAIQTQINEG
jgi:hypothetical protein